MSPSRELFRVLADAKRLPHEPEDWEAWQQAYEAVEAGLVALEEEALGGGEPALALVLGEAAPASRELTGLPGEIHPQAGETSELSLVATARLIHRRELSPVELVQAILDRIASYGKSLNAYIACYAEEAIEAAKRAEDAVAHGRPLGPLHGIPIAVKDLIYTAGLPTTAGSRVFKDFVPSEDATVVRRLREAGAILLGKLNLHELAYGITSENPHFGAVRNPWDLNRMAGGSSGGSAAGVAASLCLGSLGTDTGGSIRIPAACCGIVGLKPTYGRVSRDGVVPLAWSLDHVGPITRVVEDAALLLEVLAGPDPHDVTASSLPVPQYSRMLGNSLKGVSIGLPRDSFFDAAEVDPLVMAAVEEAMRVLQDAGARVEDVSIPLLRHAPAIQFLTIASEATANHGRLLRTRGRELGVDVRRRLELGEFLGASQYLRAQQARRLLMRQFDAALRQVNLLVTPTLPIVAPPLGAQTVTIRGIQKNIQPVMTRFTSPLNLTGLPAISIPCGTTPEGMPVGLQIIGRAFDEATILRAAFTYQRATPWHTRRPPLGQSQQ